MLEPKYIKVLGSMTCKVQGMTLYVWEKSGYFTRSLGQSVVHCSPHLKVLCHTRHAKSYTQKLDDPSLSKVFSCMTKVVIVSKCLQILAMPKVHLMSRMFESQSAILTSWTVQSELHKSQILPCCWKFKVATFCKTKFQSLLRAASMTMYHGVSPGKFQFSTALCWSLVIGMCISIESSGLLLKLLKYCTSCKVLKPRCTQLTKVWFSKVLGSDLKFSWMGLSKWTK